MAHQSVEKPQSNLENNTRQIFVRENTLTKQIKGKLRHSEMLVVFGCRFKRRELCVLASLSLLFTIGSMGVIVMWWTSCFDSFVLSNFIIVNNSAAFLRWKYPPLNSLVKIHIFNYTNVDEYRKGLVDKLRVEDVGPFVYEESTQKTNIHFHSNSSISYQEFHSYRFRKDLSPNKKETDRIVVPNLSVLGAAAANRESFYVTRLAVSTFMRGLNADTFLNLPAHRFIWGYDDKLFELAKTVMTFDRKFPFSKLGIMAARNGTSDDVITIHSGVNDPAKIAQIERVNGEEYLKHWGTPDCNRIKGSDGTFYPVFDVRQKRPVNIYFREICRRIPMVFKKNVVMINDQVEAYRYEVPDTVFDRPDVEPENQCYCEGYACAPRGIFNMSKCAFGAPASISFPHFFKADPALQRSVAGLHPNAEKHSSYMDIHPKLGFPMGGIYRLQFNVQVKKSFGMSQMDMFRDDDMYLPVAWIEAGIDSSELPEFAVNAILTSSITLPAIENTLKYGSLLLALLTFGTMLFIFIRKLQERSRQIIQFPQISFVFS